MKINNSQFAINKLEKRVVDLLSTIVSGRLKGSFRLQKINLFAEKGGVYFNIETLKKESDEIALISNSFHFNQSDYTCSYLEICGVGDSPDSTDGAFESPEEAFEDVEFMKQYTFSTAEKNMFYEALAIAFKIFISYQDYDSCNPGGLYQMHLQMKYWPVMYKAMRLLEKQKEVTIIKWHPSSTGSDMFTTQFIYERE